jgi:Fe-S-cluster containining protein
MDLQNVIDRLHLSPEAQAIAGQIDRVWRSASALAAFPCVSKCVTCCKNADINCSTLEFEIARAYRVGKPLRGATCVFRGKTGCSVYEHRPLICRLFGYTTPYKVPGIAVSEEISGKKHRFVIASMGKCPRKRLVTDMPQSKLAEIMNAYQAILMKTGFVTIGTCSSKGRSKKMQSPASE